MIKNITGLQYNIADKVYHFTCDTDSPIQHVKEALNKFIYYAVQVEEHALSQQKSAEEKSEDVNVEPPKEGENGDQQ